MPECRKIPRQPLLPPGNSGRGSGIEIEMKGRRQTEQRQSSQKKERKMREYTTQMDAARKGIITKELKIVAEKEHMQEEE